MPRKRPQTQASSINDLPPCAGPKLHQFQHHRSPIQWMERLDDDRGDGAGAEGYVFRAIIRKKQYAIKVFKFYDPWSSEYYWGPLLGEDAPIETAAYYTDPFFAECRAYGRIEGATRRGKLKGVAVPCHGYMFLKKADERILNDRGVDLGLDDVDIDFQQTVEGGCRPRAIVKDYVPGDTGVNKKSARKILRGIRDLNKLKIYNKDIRIDNFRNGQLVDFGSSWTEPHALMDALGAQDVSDHKVADLALFDEMIEEEEIETKVRGLPNPEYCSKLRSWDDD
ncbi:hypothetical protein CEP54_012019 [Fusarium duplospermum]|uniref:Protein kinase domain-containing protein n=1 Tax=Fusarium duplospermum TaxID=1325734 RepID=A0A428PB02_9HYPO|nr:hypothetical protein CEP54_012019 [Fusarium duplospermum]